MSDPISVSYHDVSLRSSDVELLSGDYWLNDNIIAYYYEVLTYEKFKDYANDILFVQPGTIFMTTFTDEALAPLKLNSKKIIFFPVNNNKSIAKVGGSHWALLVFLREKNVFHFYDSYDNHNLEAGKGVANKMWKLLEVDSLPPVEAIATPQQKNGFDCGLYVLSISEYLANDFIGKHLNIKQIVTSDSVSALRKAIKDHILSYKLEKSGGSLFGLSRKKKKETTPAPPTNTDSNT